MSVEELIGVRDRGEGVICRRFRNEEPLHFARVEAITPERDKRGALSYTVTCRDKAGCRYTVKPEWLSPNTESGGENDAKLQ